MLQRQAAVPLGGSSAGDAAPCRHAVRLPAQSCSFQVFTPAISLPWLARFPPTLASHDPACLPAPGLRHQQCHKRHEGALPRRLQGPESSHGFAAGLCLECFRSAMGAFTGPAAARRRSGSLAVHNWQRGSRAATARGLQAVCSTGHGGSARSHAGLAPALVRQLRWGSRSGWQGQRPLSAVAAEARQEGVPCPPNLPQRVPNAQGMLKMVKIGLKSDAINLATRRWHSSGRHLGIDDRCHERHTSGRIRTCAPASGDQSFQG